MKNSPTISVIMSAYNAEVFIQEAVDSVLNQTFQDFEFIVFDDCSQDRTIKILNSYEDSRIKLIANETNRGLTRNLITGMQIARGQYVARMDADDICLPNRFKHQLDYFTQHPEISVLGSAVTFFEGNDYEFIGYQPETHDEIKVTLLLEFTMLHPSIMMRKTDFDEHGLTYDAAFECSQDHDLWTRAIQKLRFANMHEPLLRMRNHSGKIGIQHKSQQEELSNTIRLRQINELQVRYTKAEIDAFNLASGMVNKFSAQQLNPLESIYLRIIQANKICNIYNHKILQEQIATKYRGVCRHLLCKGDCIGMQYWRSEIRKFDTVSYLGKIGLIYRSLACRKILHVSKQFKS